MDNKIENPDVPDTSYGDYYCTVCDSHMNGISVWEAHVIGKKHIKNVKKGITETKYEDPLNPESSIKYELRNVKDPVVGLSYMYEIRKNDKNIAPTFSCFLCHATITSVQLVIEHIISMKHRLNYIKVQDPGEYELIQNTNLKKDAMESIVADVARVLQSSCGTGTVKVKQEKKKATTYSSQETFQLHDDASYKNSKFDSNTSFKKSYVKSKRWERSRSKSYENNYNNRRRNRSRSRSRSRSKSKSRSKNRHRRSWSRSTKSSRSTSYEDNYRRKSRSPRKFYERKRSYYDKKHSVSSSKRSFSKRDLSPYQDTNERPRSLSKRNASPKHDYNHKKSSDDNLRTARKSNLLVNSSSVSPKYHHTITQESNGKPYSNPEHDIASFIAAVKNSLSERSATKQNQKKTPNESLMELISYLPFKDIHSVLDYFQQSTSLCNAVNFFQTIQFINELQARLNQSEYFRNYITARNVGSVKSIPGLGDNVSSSDKQQYDVRPSFSQENVDYRVTANPEDFLNNIFKQTNCRPNEIPDQVPYYSPTNSFQQAGHQAHLPGNPSTNVPVSSRSNYRPNEISAQVPYQSSTNNSQQPGYQAHPGNPSTNVPVSSGQKQVNIPFTQASNYSNYSTSFSPNYLLKH